VDKATNGMAGIRTFSTTATTPPVRWDGEPSLLWSRRLLCSAIHDGSVVGTPASATLTTATSRQVLGVAPPSMSSPPRAAVLLKRLSG
jgi:hypothetical protein